MEKIKWGIIGAGRIAEKFASDLKHTEDGELTAVASTSSERASDFAKRHGAAFSFGSYDELFSVPLDVVYVATPHTYHAAHTLLCLNHGVGVMCEKPFAMNASEVASMIKMAKEKKIFLMEAFWTRFLPSTLKTLELIESGAIGNILSVHADFGFKADYNEEGRAFNPKLGGGAFLDIGIYPAFLSLLLLGYPSEICAKSLFAPTGVDLSTSFIYKYENNSIAVLDCTFGANTPCLAFINGDLGRIEISRKFHESRQIKLVLNNGTEKIFDFPRETFGYNYETEEVHRCIKNNQIESEILPLSFSENLIKLLDATRAAANISYNL
jgi:predicted dehydrogenase